MSQEQPAGQDVAELLADDLIAVAEQIVVLRERSGRMPLADSQFMRELPAERDLVGPPPWGDEPLMMARNLAIAISVAIGDHLVALADAIRRYAPFAAPVACRATLEACAVVVRIAEPGISPRERVRRMTNERLRSLEDDIKVMADVGMDQHLPTVQAKVAAILEIAEQLGYPLWGKWLASPVEGENAHPGMTQLVEAVFNDDLGRMLYHVTSSASHSRLSGLMRSVKPDADRPEFGVQTGRIQLWPLELAMYCSAALQAVLPAVNALAVMNGWDNAEFFEVWRTAGAHAEQARRQFGPDSGTETS